MKIQDTPSLKASPPKPQKIDKVYKEVEEVLI